MSKNQTKLQAVRASDEPGKPPFSGQTSLPLMTTPDQLRSQTKLSQKTESRHKVEDYESMDDFLQIK